MSASLVFKGSVLEGGGGYLIGKAIYYILRYGTGTGKNSAFTKRLADMTRRSLWFL